MKLFLVVIQDYADSMAGPKVEKFSSLEERNGWFRMTESKALHQGALTITVSKYNNIERLEIRQKSYELTCRCEAIDLDVDVEVTLK